MQRQTALVAVGAVFKQIDSLPRTQSHAALGHGNGKLTLGQCRADMGGHVIGPFRRMSVKRKIIGHRPFKKIIEIMKNGRVRIFLDDE